MPPGDNYRYHSDGGDRDRHDNDDHNHDDGDQSHDDDGDHNRHHDVRVHGHDDRVHIGVVDQPSLAIPLSVKPPIPIQPN